MGTLIPLSFLRDLKCRHCSKYLSCGPVYVTPDCGLLCGRCKTLAKPNFRNYVFEELASIFQFPCLNWEKHCPKIGAWNSLIDHELDCPYNQSCRLLCLNPSAMFSSNRNLPSDENFLYMEVPENCLNVVSCKNCGKYLSCDPVHINVVGSNICHRCFLSNGAPPQTLRNLAYERIAGIFRFPCIFRAKGCPIKFRFGRDSWEHEVSCRYRNVTITSTPSTPQLSMDCIQLPFETDDSGYRPSGTSLASRSFNRNPPNFELPRVSSILKQQEQMERERMNQLRRIREFDKNILANNQSFNLERDSSGQIVGNKFEETTHLDSERVTDKEKGIIPTHTGHVYATITKNSILFAPPQIQPNKDPSSGMKLTREFQDKIRRNASTASSNESSIRENKLNYSFSFEGRTEFRGTQDKNSIYAHPPMKMGKSYDFSAFNKNQVRDFGRDVAPDVEEYTKYNPQNNVQRNDSTTIGNPELIAELRSRNEQKKKQGKSHLESPNNVEGNEYLRTDKSDLISELKWINALKNSNEVAQKNWSRSIDVH